VVTTTATNISKSPAKQPGIFQRLKQAIRPKRVKTPTLLQMEAVECGAAALGIVMGYYGRVVPLEELRIACGVSRNGSRANNILTAARRYGFIAEGFRRSPEKIRAEKLPTIVFWNFNHFLVVEGFKRNKVYLNDPATGPRVVPYQEFDESFTGVTLRIEPGPTFVKGGRRPSLIRGLQSRLVGSRTALAYILVASLCLTLLGLAVPSFTRIFVDRFLVQGFESWVLPLMLLIGTVALVLAGFTWLQQLHLLRLETKLSVTTSAQFFWHVLRLPIDFFNQRRAADISVRVGINDSIAQLLSGELATNALNIVLILFYLIVMIQYDVVLTGVGILMASLNIIALRLVSRRRVDANQRLLTEQGKLLSTAFNGLQMIETIKATGSESDFFARWAGYQAKALNVEQQLGRATELLAIVPPTLLAVNTAAILTVGGLRVIAGQLTVGELIAFQALVLAFLLPVTWIVNLGGRLQQTSADMARMDDVLRYPLDNDARQALLSDEADTNPQKLTGYVELRDITFGYNRLDPPLIEGFNLTLKPGARVALVGGSGSGKSTIAKLVAGIYEPWSGEILFDGKVRSDIPRTQLKNSLAMVDQDIYLLEGTIRDNVTMWDNTIPQANVIQAAKDAAIHDSVAARLGGYYDTVAEGGTNFSGGQRQRLEIARALANNPSILIMDEATSALDPITEKVIDDSLRRRGCTCLIVAHRLSTIRDCEEIIVMEKGKVVQRGTHDKMIRQDGPYARLIKTDESQKSAKSILDLI
jgi:NHLM bacteriocin system ABC transporter peptidase/ATP-binding protein